MNIIVMWMLFACGGIAGAGAILPAAVSAATAQEHWKTEFEDICAKTQDAMSLTKDELRALIDRCDKLKPEIEKLDESTSKVYLKRLSMCRALYVFALESSSQK